ncbi:MAG TPA: YciI family protein [Acidobacteriaceae bacterium]|nr:YciI family protein [Acidobacteriaceae bacterium]
MPQFLVAIHHPDDYQPSLENEAMIRDIVALNKQMVAAGVRAFVGGLSSASNAKSLRADPHGKVLTTDGPYLEAKEHVGGFWVLECADLDEALAWGRKAVVACRTPVEVRSFLTLPKAHQAVVDEKTQPPAPQ